MKPNFKLEKKYWDKGKLVIGIDEVGRGAFAGPLVAAGIVFPKVNRVTKKVKFLRQVNDSKQLKPADRRKLSKKILKFAKYYHIEEIDIETINKIGIARANHEIMRCIVLKITRKIGEKNIFVICDGLPVPHLANHEAIIDGDCKSISIAAASIVAKVRRDSIMRAYSRKYHNYKFARNKGYGTKSHQKALFKYGLTDIHRRSFDLNKFLRQSEVLNEGGLSQ